MKVEIVIGLKSCSKQCLLYDLFLGVKCGILLNRKRSSEPQVINDVWRTVERDIIRHIVTGLERGPKRDVLANIRNNVKL